VTDYEYFMENKEVRKSANELRAIWACGNEYLQLAEPWSTFKSDPDTAAMQIRLSFNLIKMYGILSAPFIPDASDKILKALNLSNLLWPDNIREALDSLPENGCFEVPEVMFRKITDEERETWKEQFSGN
jgi:methionyl-tRNA synthetase